MIYWNQWRLDNRATQINELEREWKNVSRVNMTDSFVKDLKIRASSKMNYILSGFGKQGMGKSYTFLFVMEQWCKFAGVEPDIKNVVFMISDALARVEKMDKGDVLILDEQVYSAGTGSKTERENLRNMERTVRQHRISLFFLAPDFISHSFHNFIETWKMGSDRKWNWKQKNPLGQWKYTMSLLYNNNEALLGHIVTETPRNKDFLEKYEKKKSKFVDQMRKSQSTGRYSELLNYTHKIIKTKGFEKTWSSLKSKSLKALYLQSVMRGKNLPGEQIKQMVNYIDFYFETGEEFKI